MKKRLLFAFPSIIFICILVGCYSKAEEGDAQAKAIADAMAGGNSSDSIANTGIGSSAPPNQLMRNGLRVQKLSIIRGLLMNASVNEIKRVLGEPDKKYTSPSASSQPYEMQMFWFSAIDDIDNAPLHICLFTDYRTIYNIKTCRPGEYIKITGFQKVKTPLAK